MNDALVWAGTDDGYVHVSQDGGASWTEVGANIPGLKHRIWVSRVEPSNTEEGRCYVTLDNHRYDDMKPYVFVTEDYGKTWTNISNNLPEDFSAYVICEDPVNPNLLFVGTEEAVHFSYNRGQEWHELMGGMPTVAIHDLIIHPREGDLIAGTHGRSIWILDDISALRQLADMKGKDELYVFDSKVATKWQYTYTGRTQPHFEFRGRNPQFGAPIQFYLKESYVDSVQVTVEDPFSDHSSSWKAAVGPGLNRIYWDFQFPPTAKKLEEQKKHLAKVVVDLNKRVKRQELLDRLTTFEEELGKATDAKALNKVRKSLTEYFAGYAGGKPYFGEKLFSKEAEAGRYKVIIEAGKRKAVGWIMIREDPLLKR